FGAGGIKDHTVDPRLTAGFCRLSAEAINIAARPVVGAGAAGAPLGASCAGVAGAPLGALGWPDCDAVEGDGEAAGAGAGALDWTRSAIFAEGSGGAGCCASTGGL